MAQVLLVEPDKLLANTYVAAFKAAHIPARWESTAQGAINFLDGHKPGLIILELQLTDHNGVEFLYELRSHHDLQDVPVVLHTIIPDTDLGLNEEAKRRLGIISYNYKPQTTLQQLLDEVKILLKRSS